MLTEIVFFTSLVFTTITSIISAINLLYATKVENIYYQKLKRISVLIPARNEEKNLPVLFNTLSSQTYPIQEIIVLNDNSSDNTEKIILKYQKENSIIKLIKGKELPKDWLGKNWACNQLSENAKGDYLIFIDADVILSENAIASAVNIFEKYRLDLFSVFPTQIIKSFGEWLIVPLMNRFLLTFLPLNLVYNSKNSSLSAANGQFLMFSKEYYLKTGGHSSVKNKVVEDMEFVRKVKKSGGKALTAVGWNSIFCNMYTGFIDSFLGFSKNFFPGFNGNVFMFVVLLIIIAFSFFLPFVFIFINIKFLFPTLIALLSGIFVSIISKQNIILNILLYPLQMFLMVFVGINSVFQTYFGLSKWKGRSIPSRH